MNVKDRKDCDGQKEVINMLQVEKSSNRLGRIGRIQEERSKENNEPTCPVDLSSGGDKGQSY